MLAQGATLLVDKRLTTFFETLSKHLVSYPPASIDKVGERQDDTKIHLFRLFMPPKILCSRSYSVLKWPFRSVHFG